MCDLQNCFPFRPFRRAREPLRAAVHTIPFGCPSLCWRAQCTIGRNSGYDWAKFGVRLGEIRDGMARRQERAVDARGVETLRLRLFGQGERIAGELPPLRLTHEAAIDRMNRLPRMFTEPDGSFLWKFDSGQLEGTIYDDGERIRYIDIAGRASAEVWSDFLGALGESFESVALELLDSGKVVTGRWLIEQD